MTTVEETIIRMRDAAPDQLVDMIVAGIRAKRDGKDENLQSAAIMNAARAYLLKESAEHPGQDNTLHMLFTWLTEACLWLGDAAEINMKREDGAHV